MWPCSCSFCNFKQRIKLLVIILYEFEDLFKLIFSIFTRTGKLSVVYKFNVNVNVFYYHNR